MTALPRAAGLVYRSVGDVGAHVALLVHGYPESSYMWDAVLRVLPAAGWRGVAPDLAGYGDSPPDPPGTWERHVEALERFRDELGLERVVLVVHDWGGLIGLRWACEHPDAVSALVISDSGFFPDGKWHGMAQVMRTPKEGEELLASLDHGGFATLMRQSSPGIEDSAIAEYWKCFADEDRRRGHLELYRSGDFEKLAPYEGRLASLGVPVLLLWGENDPFAPVAGAHRFMREIPEARLEVIEDAGHFVFDEEPERCARAIVDFLSGVVAGA